MSSTGSVNPALSQLFQTLSATGSPLMSSPKVVSALEQAPPSDIAELSAQAIQLEGMNAVLGNTGTGASNPDSLFSAVYGTGSPDPSSTGPAAGLEQALLEATGNTINVDPNAPQTTDLSATAPASAANSSAINSYAQNIQLQEAQSLLGIDPLPAGGTTASTLFG